MMIGGCIWVCVFGCVWSSLCANLRHVHLVVVAFSFHQMFVRPLLYNQPIGHDHYLVDVLNSAQSMGDDDAGATGSRLVQRLLHHLL